MPSSNTRQPQNPKSTSIPLAKPDVGEDDLNLHGDIEPLKFVFLNTNRHMVSTSVPDSVYVKLQAYPGGISRFFEDAVAAFDGDLRALVEASVQFVEDRRIRSPEDPVRNASGRVLPGTFEKIQKIHAALAEIRGMSRAKVLAGLMRLKLTSSS